MPYAHNHNLPPAVRAHLPAHAQDIFREAFNHVLTEYDDEGDTTAFLRRVVGREAGLQEGRRRLGTEAQTRMSAIGRAPAVSVAVALVVLLVGVPAVMSLSRGDGTVCVAASGCGLSAINPCTRHPAFAVVGRCAFPLQGP
jgi:cation transport regulator